MNTNNCLKQYRPFAAGHSVSRAFEKLSRTCLTLLLIGGVVLTSMAVPNKESYSAPPNPNLQRSTRTSHQNLVESFGQLPLTFELNQGQLAKDVKFLSRTTAGDIYLTSKETIISLRQPSALPKEMVGPTSEGQNNKRLFDRQVNNPGSKSRDAIKMRVVGSNAASVLGEDEVPGSVNYFIGKDPKKWHTNVRSFSRVAYKNIYPGIDQVFYGAHQQLEYDFVVSPGSNPHNIKLAFSGSEGLFVDQGDLVLRVKDSGDIRLKEPVAYQIVGGLKHQVPAKYVINRNRQVGFEIGDYDSSKTLTIDPILSYSTYLGGGGNDAGFDVGVDGSGNAYITGSTDSSEFSSLGGSNAFVAKLNASGTQRTYLAILGGSGDDTGFSLAVDGSGNAYVTGATDSVDFPAMNAIQSSSGGGSQDAFVAKLNPAGSAVIYSTYFGGTGNDAGFGLAIDSAENAYVTGSTDSTEFSTLGNTNAFVMKLNSQGNERPYLAVLGGNGDDTGFDIAVDGIGNAYVVGSTDSSNFTTAGALQPNFGGSQDAFVAKLDGAGSSLIYSTYLGGTGNDSGFGIAVDGAGNAYVTGSTDSTEISSLGGRDVFVAKFNAAGNDRTYFTVLGGSGDDAGFAIAVDNAGNAYVTGSTDSGNFTTSNPLQPTAGGSQDVFVAKLNPAGATLDYSTFIGNSGNESGFAVAVDSGGNAFATGFTSSNNFPTASSFQSVSGGNGDAFVLRISNDAAAPSVQFSSSSYVVSEGTPRVEITLNRSGDTSAAANVGFVTSDGAGSQNCNVVNGIASSRCDYISTLGTFSFAPGEASKTVSIFIIDDAYVEGSETFNITLSNPSGVALGPQSSGSITINDNDSTNGLNPNDQAAFFVSEHYFDFLNRQPDTGGLNFWTNEIASCGANAQCLELKRINVSAAFFLSIEFQQTGYLVERLYKSAYGNGIGVSTLGGSHQISVPIVRLNEFLPDTQQIGQGVVVNQGNWQQQLNDNKNAFTAEFVQRPRFTNAFPASMSPAQFVDTLNANAGNPLSPAERNQLVADLTSGAKTRAQVLRIVAEDPDLSSAESNRAFVLMQFFGYLRRNPNDPQDTDYTGYDFWLAKLNQFNGNFVNAEMVKAFITSSEYRQRFGP